MKEYNSVSEPFLADVRAVVGDANVFTEPEKLEQYKTDEEYDPRRFRVPEAVVRPANAEEIAAVVKLCNKYNVPLSAAAVPALPMARLLSAAVLYCSWSA